MKKAAVIAGLFVALFLGSMVAAQARTHVSIGIGIGVGPAVPFGYYYPAYPPYYYSDYYAYPYYYDDYYYYPAYRTYVGPRNYYGTRYRSYDRYYRDRHDGSRWNYRGSRSTRGSRSGRWR
jgi:hypothetical protein